MISDSKLNIVVEFRNFFLKISLLLFKKKQGRLQNLVFDKIDLFINFFIVIQKDVIMKTLDFHRKNENIRAFSRLNKIFNVF